MSVKSLIIPRIAAKMLSEKTRDKKRARFERARIEASEDHIVEFFHDPSDPYSQLLHKVLPKFTECYKINLLTHLVSPPDAAAAPEREKLTEYSKMDAMRLAKKAGIDFKIEERAPASNTSVAYARREKLGHYLGGTLYYGGEWYWGLDRLHYLEERLMDMGLRHGGNGRDLIYAPPQSPSGLGRTNADLHWYLSFRSPYSAIVRDRVKSLADAYGADLKIRFVLPMVMRGLPVPKAKKKYIPLDTAREARRNGVDFGRVLDPVGRPVELGYSLLPWAREHSREYDYVQGWLKAVWAEGIDAGAKSGIQKIVERAGLNWNEAKDILGNDDWRAEAEANRLEMMERGVWGVPSFRVGETITWGQDRLWVIEHALQKQIKS
ncbi:DsbA family protein [Hellea balneolensis]|uniref:DsbA family protein n=1 Tax=Hellea balneolensis TaxID=287478 RepID=UPI00040B725A|nr:DsbA family protein [Hellea balneolensis]